MRSKPTLPSRVFNNGSENGVFVNGVAVKGTATESVSRTNIRGLSELLTKYAGFTKNPDASRGWRESAKTWWKGRSRWQQSTARLPARGFKIKRTYHLWDVDFRLKIMIQLDYCCLFASNKDFITFHQHRKQAIVQKAPAEPRSHLTQVWKTRVNLSRPCF